MVARLWSRWRSLAHEGAWVLAGQGAAAIGAVVVTCLLAHWLTPSQYGVFALGLTASTFGQMILFGPWAGSALRFESLASGEGNTRDFLHTVTRTQWQLTLLGGVLGGAVLVVLGLTGHRLQLPLVVATIVTVIAGAWAALASALQSARRQRAIIAVHQGLTPWLRLVLVLALFRLLDVSSTMTMAGWGLANLLIAWSQWRYLRRPAPAPDGAEHGRYRMRMISYAAPFVLWGLFACAQASVDRWSLRSVTDLATVGIYSTAYQLGYAPALLLGSFVEQMVAPVVFAGAGDALDAERLRRSHRRVFIAVAALVVAAVLGSLVAWLGASLVRRLLPPAYQQVSMLVAPLFLAGGIFAAAQVLIIAPLTSFDSRRVILPRIATSVLAVAALVVGAETDGMRGVVVGQIAVSLVFLAWFLIVILRRRVRSGGGR